jgi:hypothetical protein
VDDLHAAAHNAKGRPLRLSGHFFYLSSKSWKFIPLPVFSGREGAFALDME